MTEVEPVSDDAYPRLVACSLVTYALLVADPDDVSLAPVVEDPTTVDSVGMDPVWVEPLGETVIPPADDVELGAGLVLE